MQQLQNFAVYLTYNLTLTNKHMKNSINITSNTKANIISFAIMAVILTAGIIYGMELESIGY